jgi:YHS domain-containing protein
MLAGYFSNASLSKDEPPGRCSCWFGYCERFPASTKVAFAVEHDVRFENVAVCLEVSMMPVFIKLNERDKLTSPLDEVKDEAVAEWVEQRLLEFLDSYLRIDRGGEDFDEEAVTDPVCGMRISRSAAVASDTYRGHPYFFCSRECQERFAREPTAYVEVKGL